MQNFQINFVVTDWLTINVKAKTQEEAIEKAKTVLAKRCYKNTIIETIDSKEEFVGLYYLDVIEKLN